jgi:hypothetical protein
VLISGRVRPNRFHAILETVPALHVLLTGLRDPGVCETIADGGVRQMLAGEGAESPAIRVAMIDQLQRGMTGKAPLVQARTTARME